MTKLCTGVFAAMVYLGVGLGAALAIKDRMEHCGETVPGATGIVIVFWPIILTGGWTARALGVRSTCGAADHGN